MNPGGLAGVWAESNTREDLFDALRRKETFATSGTRIRVRFFGGRGGFVSTESFEPNDADLEQAYAQGVPMGGEPEPRSRPAGAARLLLRPCARESNLSLEHVGSAAGR